MKYFLMVILLTGALRADITSTAEAQTDLAYEAGYAAGVKKGVEEGIEKGISLQYCYSLKRRLKEVANQAKTMKGLVKEGNSFAQSYLDRDLKDLKKLTEKLKKEGCK